MLLPIPPENQPTLVADLEADPFVGHALSSATCEQYHHYGMYPAPLTAALTTANLETHAIVPMVPLILKMTEQLAVTVPQVQQQVEMVAMTVPQAQQQVERVTVAIEPTKSLTCQKDSKKVDAGRPKGKAGPALSRAPRSKGFSPRDRQR
jgi:hypothetical protein